MYAYMDPKHNQSVDRILTNACVHHMYARSGEMMFDENYLDIVIGLLVDHGYKCKVEDILCGMSQKLIITMD